MFAMTTQPDLKEYAMTLANKQWGAKVNCKPYIPPPPQGDYFITSLPECIGEDEPDIRVEYTVFPAEKMTRDYPGCPAEVEIDAIVGLHREITAKEEQAALDDRRFIEMLKCEAIERQ